MTYPHDHDGDHVTYDDAVLSAVAIEQARERVRAGVTPDKCQREGCDWPATSRFGYCGPHERETTDMLDATWPPSDPECE